jgi:hypothetical protein
MYCGKRTIAAKAVACFTLSIDVAPVAKLISGREVFKRHPRLALKAELLAVVCLCNSFAIRCH